MSSTDLFSTEPPVIAALHLPAQTRGLGMAWLEDYVVTNARVFAAAGVPWLKLQDQTRTAGPMDPEALAVLASLGRFLRTEVPGIGLGIIVEAHDPAAALAVAHAAGAAFVRLKVFVGGVMTAQGPRYAAGAEAVRLRAAMGREDIALLADVHDRTAVPLSSESPEFAAQWAQKTGADGLIITGSSFADTLERVRGARDHGVRCPIMIGGGIIENNVAQALALSNGVIVSTALMHPNTGEGDLLRWDLDATRRFMDAARRP